MTKGYILGDEKTYGVGSIKNLISILCEYVTIDGTSFDATDKDKHAGFNVLLSLMKHNTGDDQNIFNAKMRANHTLTKLLRNNDIISFITSCGNNLNENEDINQSNAIEPLLSTELDDDDDNQSMLQGNLGIRAL